MNINSVAVDKLYLYNIVIVEIKDIEALKEQEIIENTSNKGKYITQSGQMFSKLRITGEGIINSFYAGRSGFGNYCKLQTSVVNESNKNLFGISIADYKEQIEVIKQILADKYGIIADFRNCKIEQIEINKTILLNHNFAEYYRPIRLIMSQLPYNFNCKSMYENSNVTNSFYAYSGKNKENIVAKNKSKNGMIFKVYDKSFALKPAIVLNDTYMRVEFVIFGAEKIKKGTMLGTNIFYELTDEIIQDFYHRQLDRMIVKPLQKYKNTRDTELRTMIIEQKDSDCYHWISNVLRLLQDREIIYRYPYILDISEINSIISTLQLSKQQKYSIRKSFKAQAEKYETAYCNDDLVKLHEVIDKLYHSDKSNGKSFTTKVA